MLSKGFNVEVVCHVTYGGKSLYCQAFSGSFDRVPAVTLLFEAAYAALHFFILQLM